MNDSAQRAIELIGDDSDDVIASDRSRLDALLWNFTVTGMGRRRVPWAGFEPATYRLGGGCSIHLSYQGVAGSTGREP